MHQPPLGLCGYLWHVWKEQFPPLAAAGKQSNSELAQVQSVVSCSPCRCLIWAGMSDSKRTRTVRMSACGARIAKGRMSDGRSLERGPLARCWWEWYYVPVNGLVHWIVVTIYQSLVAQCGILDDIRRTIVLVTGDHHQL